MSNVILSTSLKDGYSHYKVVREFNELDNMSDIECLVVHSYTDSDFNAAIHLTELARKGIKRYAYISEKIALTIQLFVQGLGGFATSDTFYYDSDDDLDYIINDFYNSDARTDESTNSSIEIIKKFIAGFASNDPSIGTSLFLEQVNNSVNALVKTNESNDVIIRDMGKATIETFKHVSDSLEAMSKQYVDLQNTINELQNTVSAQERKPVAIDTSRNGIWAFPVYQYCGRSKILYVQEYSPCRYLTTFLMAYADYLNNKMHTSCKLVIVHGRGSCILKKYSGEFASITPDSETNDELYKRNKVATNIPNKSVMDKLLSTGERLIIVVDRLYNTDGILSGSRITKVNAVSGLSDIKRYRLNVKETIFTVITVNGSLCNIPHINSFTKDAKDKLAKYFQFCEKYFEALTSLTDLNGGK